MDTLVRTNQFTTNKTDQASKRESLLLTFLTAVLLTHCGFSFVWLLCVSQTLAVSCVQQRGAPWCVYNMVRHHTRMQVSLSWKCLEASTQEALATSVYWPILSPRVMDAPLSWNLLTRAARKLTPILQHPLSMGLYEYRADGCKHSGDRQWTALIVVLFLKAPSDILRIIGCCLGVAPVAEDAVLLSMMACWRFGRVDHEVYLCGKQH